MMYFKGAFTFIILSVWRSKAGATYLSEQYWG